jgi:hypothetical protein
MPLAPPRTRDGANASDARTRLETSETAPPWVHVSECALLAEQFEGGLYITVVACDLLRDDVWQGLDVTACDSSLSAVLQRP